MAAFTIVEFMVACVVVSIALSGVYALCAQALDAERRFTRRIQSRASAEAVADSVARTLRHAMNTREQLGIVVGIDAEGLHQLTCITPLATNGEVGGLRRIRYRWRSSVDSKEPVDLSMAQALYAGSSEISSWPSREGASTDPWQSVPEVVIGSRLDGFSVEFSPRGGPQPSWTEHWAGPAGNTLVRIVCRVGEETVERIVAPHVASLFDREKEAR